MANVADVLVPEGATIRQVLEAMTRSGKQVALVVDPESRLVGLVTDGDLRKAILRGAPLEAKVEEAMNRTPIVGVPGLPTAEAITLMRTRSIRQLPLLDARGVVKDLLILEELLEPLPPLRNRAIIMAGGEGKRLRPLTESAPKPLLSVGGKPLLEILIDRLRQSGIIDIVVALHHKADMIRARLGDGARLGVRIEYVEEPKPLGTMGALTLIRDQLDAPFFVVNGDILTKCDFRGMWDFHRNQDAVAMTVGVSLHQIEIPYGEFTLRGSRVVEVEEKPRKEFPVNAGIYVIDPSAVDTMPTGQYCDATDLIRLLLAQSKRVAAYVISEYWLDVGRHYDFEKANRDVAEGLLD
jgi:dTDP-glucose pyrophosphorylase/predicted transcriptional regulator